MCSGGSGGQCLEGAAPPVTHMVWQTALNDRMVLNGLAGEACPWEEELWKGALFTVACPRFATAMVFMQCAGVHQR